MKYIFTFLIFCCCYHFSTAQVEEKSLLMNPFLVEKTWQDVQAQEARLRAVETAPAETRGGGKGYFEDTLYIVSGEKYKFKLDTFGFGADTVIVKKNGLKFGTASNVYNIISIDTKTGIKIGIDTLQLFLPNPKKTDTLCYWVIVRRSDKNIQEPQSILKAEAEKTVCVSFKDLPGKIKSSTILDCDNLSIAREVRKASTFLDSCVYFGASRLGGRDTVCLKVCDEYKICDTHYLPFKVLQDTLSSAKSLTFMDDFSYQEGYPNRVNWLDDRAFVNNTMSFNPPSRGMATFDGLNETGRPYNGGYGVSDVLTSAYLDLSGSTKDTLFLSYYVEQKGYGYGPSKEDYFSIEFKNGADQWFELPKDTIQGTGLQASSAPPGFKYYCVGIPKIYQYKGFQFRFAARGSRTGINDVWNLDYVRLSDEKPYKIVAGKKIPLPFADIAFVNNPPSLLKNYTTMPMQQFKGFEQKEINAITDFTINSQFANVENITIANVLIKENTSNTMLLDGYNFITKLNQKPGYSGEIAPFVPTANSNFFDNLKTLPVSAKEMNFTTEYAISVPEQNKVYKTVLKNDTTRTKTRLSNFYAYDDGSPESVIAASGTTDVQVAVRFTTNVADVLRGVWINFPYFNKINTNQKFNLRVFVGQLSQKPTYEKIFLTPIYNTSVINGFSYYELVDKDGKPAPLAIPKGDFYVGWQAATVSAEPIVVGFDKNNPQAAKYNFGSTQGTWQALGNSAKGAILLRPVLTKDGVITADEDVKTFDFDVYPNPTSNELFISGLSENVEKVTYQIFDLNGKNLQQGQLDGSINVEHFTNGVYLLRLSSNGKSQLKKFVVLK
jgi:Secretion system C-terminal sorting domain